MLQLLLSALLCFQSVSLSPSVIEIPPDKQPIGRWPNFESDPGVAYTTITINYNVGPNGLAQDKKLHFMFAYPTGHELDGNPKYTLNNGWIQVPIDSTAQSPMGRWQTTAPTAINYVSITCPGVTFRRRTVTHVHNLEKILQIEPKVPVPPNSVISIVVGDTSQGSPGLTMSWHPGRPKLVVFEDPDEDGIFTQQNINTPELLFTGQDADAFITNIPMNTRVGVPFRVTVRAVQGRDLTPTSFICPVEDFAGSLAVDSDDIFASFPQSINISASDHGVTSFYATFGTPGYHFIRVRIPGNDETRTMSNISRTTQSETMISIYVGDLHRHSGEGGHASIPDPMVWQELYDDNNDFGSVMQHSTYVFAGFPGQNLSQSRFQLLIDPTESNFISFPGYEWSLVGNHRHVIYQNTTSEPAIIDGIYNGTDIDTPTVITNVGDFLNAIGNTTVKSLAIIHHPLWNMPHPDGTLYDWGTILQNVNQPLAEIYSRHGSSERFYSIQTDYNYLMKHDTQLQRSPLEMASIADGLRLGYKFGIIAGSDRHTYAKFTTDEMPGDYTRTGLSMIVGRNIIPSLRDRIWDGLYSRHTYGTTGAKIHLMFTANNYVMMGDVIHESSVTFNIRAHASGTTKKSVNSKFILLEIYRDGYDLVDSRSYTGGIEDLNLSWQDPLPINDNKEHSYFVRLTQDDNHVAWSSPIWWLKLN